MSEHHSFLSEALRRVIAGGDISNEELAAGVPDAKRLKGSEQKAYLGLSYWTDDGDIRAKDPTYAPVRREGLKRLLNEISPALILPFEPRHAAAWAALNLAWLKEGGFAVEAKDRRVIDDPIGAILAPGGHIFMVQQDGQALGCCALMAMADGGFEVAKMTVTPAARGQGLSRRLLEACEAEARAASAHRLYLESASSLTVARALYRSFGFVDLPPRDTPYARADVFMEKRL